ncbi:protein cueball [Teleopsis dalmanni]|uniref:protein cueball n=1 Tax=Teleopsis dalmanni TaxID=139649 RepID=UPI0018CFED77|nr:protein cueball [Teleopsis dalmanni]
MWVVAPGLKRTPRRMNDMLVPTIFLPAYFWVLPSATSSPTPMVSTVEAVGPLTPEVQDRIISEFAVTTNTRVFFYDINWKIICADLHHFTHLTASTFDEAEGTIYFNDRQVQNISIFSLQLDDEDKTRETFVRNVPQEEEINGIAYDPLERILYWTDSKSIKIYKWGVKSSNKQQPAAIISFHDDYAYPSAISLDFCKRKLYWSDLNIMSASIESSNLDGSNRKVIVNDDLSMAYGMVVDQFDHRLYWISGHRNNRYTIESAKLDGTDRRILFEKEGTLEQRKLAVTFDKIYWTDSKTIKSILKNNNNTLETTLTFDKDYPNDIVARTHYLKYLKGDRDCDAILKQINMPKSSKTESDVDAYLKNSCLNGGTYNENSRYCVCNRGFTGSNCQINECQNFCLNGGSCSYDNGPKCQCAKGYNGNRCQFELCYQYCMNGGVCKLDSYGNPTCTCRNTFPGNRCEQNKEEICELFCNIPPNDRSEVVNGYNCQCTRERMMSHNMYLEQDTLEVTTKHPVEKKETNEINQNMTKELCTLYCKIPLTERASLENDYQCNNYCQAVDITVHENFDDICRRADIWTSSVIIVLICGIVACLALVFLIVKGIHRFYKPLRPQIKKTFVVRKNAPASDTPLTNRPMATEQCEITIENCCNMNICETPCFDPKLIQKSFKNSSKKDLKDECEQILT